ncbi:MAG: restriction endonuclease subunit S [Betaproteobacteria bacterium]|nr:restriction endonuclease subunit S [Betaproteobacteria bacterium]
MPLADACEKITDGTHHSPPIQSAGVPYVTAKHIKEDGCDFFSDPWFVSEDDHRAIFSRCDPRPGDVLYIKDGATTGIAAVNRYAFEFSMLSSVALLRPRAAVLTPEFLCHWLNAPLVKRRILDGMVGVAIRRLTLEKIKAIRVPLPPIPEQRRIAEILDKADALRAKRRAALAQLDTLTQSIFLDMFGDPATNPKGWPVRTTGDLLESASYGTSEKSEATGEFPVLRMNNISRTGDTDLSDLKYMNLDEGERDRYLVRTGDVLFNRTNSPELVGKTAIFREARPMAYAGYLIRLRVNRENDPEYLACFLNTAYSKRVLRGMCKSIVGMANINATEVQAIRIPQPPVRVQNEFACRVAGVEKLKSMHRNSLAEFDSLFASLQHRAFRGLL